MVAFQVRGPLSPLAAVQLGATGLVIPPAERFLFIDYRALLSSPQTGFDIAVPRLAALTHSIARRFRPAALEPFRPLGVAALLDRKAYAELRHIACYDTRAEKLLDRVSEKIIRQRRLFASQGNVFVSGVLHYLDQGYVVPVSSFERVFQRLFDDSVDWKLSPWGGNLRPRYHLTWHRLDREADAMAAEFVHRIISGPWGPAHVHVVDNGVGFEWGSSLMFASMGSRVVANEPDLGAAEYLERDLKRYPDHIQQAIELVTSLSEIDTPHPSRLVYWISPHPGLFEAGPFESKFLGKLGTQKGAAYMARDVAPGGALIIQFDIEDPPLFTSREVIEPLSSREWKLVAQFQTPGSVFPTAIGRDRPQQIHIYRRCG